MATQRITSKDIRIEFLPRGAVATHVQKLYFDAGVSGGTFKLRVNGILTAAITYSDTAATLVSNINSALDAILGSGLLVATGAASTEVTLTGASTALNRYFVISFEAVSLTGGADPVYQTEVITQGAETIVLSAEASSFSHDVKTETVDVTAISEYNENKIAVKESMTFEIDLFNSQQTWLYVLRAQNQFGTFTVYPTGKLPNHRVFSFSGLIEGVSDEYPDHEKVEINISGSRIGAMILPFESLYVG